MDPERLRREREFFDASSVAQSADDAPVATEHVLMLLEMLGDPKQLRILDCGCGAGELALELAQRGARVIGFDLSPESVRLMAHRAEQIRVPPPSGLVSVMERLPFPDGAFDIVVGKSILHHVEIAPAMTEIRRVMVSGGRALFIENQVTNPLLRFARARLTGRFGVARVGTLDEHPLVKADYAMIARLFPRRRLAYPDFRFFGLFSRNVLRYRRALWLVRLLDRLDRVIYRYVKPLRRWGYHVILEVRKGAS